MQPPPFQSLPIDAPGVNYPAASGGSPPIFTRTPQTSVVSGSAIDFKPVVRPPRSERGHLFTQVICMCCGKKLVVPVYCGDRFCNICGKARRGRILARLKFLIDNMEKIRGYSLKMLTFTIANRPSLPEMLRKLLSSFRKLRARAFWKNNVEGGAFVLEVTGRPGNWHAHIHALCSCRYIPWAKLHALWFKVSSGRGVYISKSHGTTHAQYLVKYITKTDAPDQVLDEVSLSLKGFRLFQPFGTWFKLIKQFPPHRSACSDCKKTGTFELAAQHVGGQFQFMLFKDDIEVWLSQTRHSGREDEGIIYEEPKAPF